MGRVDTPDTLKQPSDLGDSPSTKISTPRSHHQILWCYIWVFPKIGVPQNGWFIMENPIKMDTIIFGNTHIPTLAKDKNDKMHRPGIMAYFNLPPLLIRPYLRETNGRCWETNFNKGWNHLKMMISKIGISYSRGPHFQVKHVKIGECKIHRPLAYSIFFPRHLRSSQW